MAHQRCIRVRVSPDVILFARQDHKKVLSLSKAVSDMRAPVRDVLASERLHEIVAAGPASQHAGAIFGLLAAAQTRRAAESYILAVSLELEAQESGRLNGAGLTSLGIDAATVYAVNVKNEKDLLWTAEDGASCSALGGVVALLGRTECLYGFTASRRLKLRCEKSGTPVFIVRHGARDATAAAARWRIGTAASKADAVAGSAMALPGCTRLFVMLERYRGLKPQSWEIELNATQGFSVVASLSDRPADPVRQSRKA